MTLKQFMTRGMEKQGDYLGFTKNYIPGKTNMFTMRNKDMPENYASKFSQYVKDNLGSVIIGALNQYGPAIAANNRAVIDQLNSLNLGDYIDVNTFIGTKDMSGIPLIGNKISTGVGGLQEQLGKKLADVRLGDFLHGIMEENANPALLGYFANHPEAFQSWVAGPAAKAIKGKLVELGLPEKSIDLSDLNKFDMWQHAPGMAAAFGIPFGIGALTGHPGWGALLGLLGAGGYGYYQYNKMQHDLLNSTAQSNEETPAPEAPATISESPEDLDAPANPETTEALPAPEAAPASAAEAPALAPAVEKPAPVESAPAGEPRARSISTDAPLDPEDQSLVDELDEWSANPESKSEPDVVAQPGTLADNTTETPTPATALAPKVTPLNPKPGATTETAPSAEVRPTGGGTMQAPATGTPAAAKPKLQPKGASIEFNSIDDIRDILKPAGELRVVDDDDDTDDIFVNNRKVGFVYKNGGDAYLWPEVLPGIDLSSGTPHTYWYDQSAFREAYPDADWQDRDDHKAFEIRDKNNRLLAYTISKKPDSWVGVFSNAVDLWGLGTELPTQLPAEAPVKPEDAPSPASITKPVAPTATPSGEPQPPVQVTTSTFVNPPATSSPEEEKSSAAPPTPDTSTWRIPWRVISRDSKGKPNSLWNEHGNVMYTKGEDGFWYKGDGKGWFRGPRANYDTGEALDEAARGNYILNTNISNMPKGGVFMDSDGYVYDKQKNMIGFGRNGELVRITPSRLEPIDTGPDWYVYNKSDFEKAYPKLQRVADEYGSYDYQDLDGNRIGWASSDDDNVANVFNRYKNKLERSAPRVEDKPITPPQSRSLKPITVEVPPHQETKKDEGPGLVPRNGLAVPPFSFS